MTSKAGRRRKYRQQRPGPSRFFVIALAIGLLLLILMVSKVATTRMTPPNRPAPTSPNR